MTRRAPGADPRVFEFDRFDQVLGVDLSRPLINIARRRRPHPRVGYVAGDLLDVADPDGFDLVFSSTALHHLPDLDAALRHLRGLVAPGGMAVLIDNVAARPTPPRWVYWRAPSPTSPRPAPPRLAAGPLAAPLPHRPAVARPPRQRPLPVAAGVRAPLRRLLRAHRFHRLGHTHALVWRRPPTAG